VEATGPGTCSVIRTSVPLISLNQCGVFSGTIMKSPFSTFRGVPPSMPEPARSSYVFTAEDGIVPPVGVGQRRQQSRLVLVAAEICQAVNIESSLCMIWKMLGMSNHPPNEDVTSGWRIGDSSFYFLSFIKPSGALKTKPAA
jgi:hypothetical protein